MRLIIRLSSLVAALLLAAASSAPAATVTDALGRTVDLPPEAAHIVCSGPGCLRLVAYLQATDLVVAVDDMETRRDRFAARPYALANPDLATRPVFGGLRGADQPELILALDPRPELILKTFGGVMGHDPDELQQKTGIPVFCLDYGDLDGGRAELLAGLRTLGAILGREARAEAVAAYLEAAVADLRDRAAGGGGHGSVFLGGVAFRGPRGLASTEPAYPPFRLLGVPHLGEDAAVAGADLRHAELSREAIVAADPDIIFLDLSTLQAGPGGGGLAELRGDSAYRGLAAVTAGRVYGVLPYNWYTRNFGSVLANAYFVGAVLYPDRFADVDPAARADDIYTFLLGAPVFDRMDASFDRLVFRPIAVD